jgi:hypothetical protein
MAQEGSVMTLYPHDEEPDVDEHLRKICADAGLEVMHQVYDILRNREQVEDGELLALDDGDVYKHYEAWVAPGIDNLEKALLGDFD